MDALVDFVFEDDVFDDDLEVLDIVDFGFPRRRYFRSNYFEDLDELQFFQRFRLRKLTVLTVLVEIENHLEFPHDWNDSVSPINQLLTTLRFYATGGHISSVADYIGMHTSTASRIISKVSRVLASLRPRYISMPQNDELLDVQTNFYDIARFPRVIGCIDGTHIRIQSPGGNDAELFRNRKSYFSLNTQVVGDANLRIRDIVARWPGSTHDSTIYNNSRIRARLEAGHFPNTVILGDSGYFLSNNIMTPLLNPGNRAEQLYNESHIRTRNTIERLFGVWKRRFPILAYGIRVNVESSLNITVATAVLQNIAINSNDEEPPFAEEVDIDHLNYLIEMGNMPNVANIQENHADAALTRNVLKFFKSLWLSCVSLLHPDVEFVNYSTIRILLDTHRNQGIISVLLSVKGKENPEAIKRHLQEVVKRRDKSGNLAFPRLQQCLTTRCGIYAWQRAKFDLENHVTLAKFTYKGRAVTDFNIQEYVSEIVSKYLPSGIAPWQIVIIPTSEEHHYVLFKIHHILLSEGVNVGDLLPLIPPTRQSTGNYPLTSPIVDVLKKPEAIGNLKEKLTDDMSNTWNEFVCTYEPLERPELLKDTPTVSQFLAITVITLFSIIKECKRGFRVIRPDIFSKLRFLLITSSNESTKRNVTIGNFFWSILKSLSPKNIFYITLQSLWFFSVSVPIRLPIMLYSESVSLYSCITLKYCPYPHTFVGIVYYYIPLLYNSMKEILDMFKIIFLAPRTIIQDILFQEESLQTITLCGRKAVAWSDPVRMELVSSTARKLGVSETEVMLSACAMCISKYFVQINDTVPSELPITMRNINSQYLFATGPNIRPQDSVSGIICLNLPIVDPESDKTQLENMKDLEVKFRTSIERQGLSHLLTLLQTKFGILTNFLPSTLLSIYLKFLSRKYAVTVTEVTNKYPNVAQRTLWGQEVVSAVYWRPPQANTSISLCLNEYNDHIKVGVMCDAQLVPHHPVLVRGFPEFVKDLADSVSVPSSSRI